MLLCFLVVIDSVHLTADNLVHVLYHWTPYHPNNVPLICEANLITRFSTMKASGLITLSMALERFFATYYPFRYKNNVSRKTILEVGAICIVLAMLSTSLASATFGYREGETCPAIRQYVSPILLNVVVFESVLFFFAIPSVLTAVLNILIAVKLRRRIKRFVQCSNTKSLFPQQ